MVPLVLFKVRMKEIAKEYIPVCFLFAALTIVAFWPSFLNIASKIPSAEGDAFYFLWSMWWINFASLGLHTSAYFTGMLFYPLGANMVTWPLPIFESLLTSPIQQFGLPVSYNLILLLDYVLSGAFAYALVKYVVKDKYAAFVGGLIYAFSPIHIGHTFAGHLNWVGIEFIPLLVLCFLILIKEQKPRYSLFCAVCLLFVTFFGDFEQSLLSVLLLIVIIYFYAFSNGFRKTFTRRMLLLLLLIPLLTLAIGWPLFSQIIYSLTHSGAISTFYHLGDLSGEIPTSNSVFGFFIPSYYNELYDPIIGNKTQNFLGSFYELTYNGGVVIPNTQIITQDERTSYVGYLVLVFLVAGIYYDIKKKRHAGTVFWLNIFLLFSIMSWGPLLHLANEITGIPGPFLIYTIIPIVNIVKEAGRFYFIATIPLSIIAAVGVSEVYKRLKINGMKKRIFATALISTFIFLDYFGFILPGGTSLLFQNATIPAAYQTIQGYQKNVSVLLLPSIGNGYNQEKEIYYQTEFEKPLFNGYGKQNLSQAEQIYMLPASAYADSLTNRSSRFLSPLNENLTLLNYATAKGGNITYFGVLKKAYNESGRSLLSSYLESLFGTPVYEDNTTELFSTRSALEKQNQTMFYTQGAWIMGRLLCGYYYGINCTDSFSRGWWGSANRNITIYSQFDSSSNITFSIRSFDRSGSEKINFYLDSSTNPVNQMSIDSNETTERMSLQLKKGTNRLEFSMPAINKSGDYLTYDLHNFSIEK